MLLDNHFMKIDLSGEWDLYLEECPEGKAENGAYFTERLKELELEGAFGKDCMTLPGTTSSAGKGPENPAAETGFLTDAHRFEGCAWYRRKVSLPGVREDLHYFLHLERSRITHVWVDHIYAGCERSLATPHDYDLTEQVHLALKGLTASGSRENAPVAGNGSDAQACIAAVPAQDSGQGAPAELTLTILVVNTGYVVPGGHLTSPDTQSNWNGILGELSLSAVYHSHIKEVRVHPERPGKELSFSVLCDVYSFDFLSSISFAGELPAIPAAPPRVTAVPCILDPKWLTQDGGADSKCAGTTRLATGYHANIREDAKGLTAKSVDAYLELGEALPDPELRLLTPDEDVLELRVTIPVPEDNLWDEEDPKLIRAEVTLNQETLVLYLGALDFHAEGRSFTINGRETFLRGRHHGLQFPLLGFAPMNLAGWLKELAVAKEWGINHIRCHTCTPPEAAFLAADLLGLYYQPELEIWGTWNAPTDEGYQAAQQEFLTGEGFAILSAYAYHPSFVMMTMGNELWGNPAALDELLAGYHEAFPGILFSQGSNNFQFMPNIQPHDDFFSGVRFGRDRLIRGSYAMCDAPLGHIQTDAPGTMHTYDEAIVPGSTRAGAGEGSGAASLQGADTAGSNTVQIQFGTGVKEVKASETAELIPEIPVISHEIGQYVTYPDYSEIPDYTGPLKPRNLEIFRKRLEDAGMAAQAEDFFRASGALAMDCYRAELESALRSRELAGFQILDLQDFAGQGTALVGPLNALLESKGLITPEEWRSFCGDVVLLPSFPSCVLEMGSTLPVDLSLAWYRKELPAKGAVLVVEFAEKQTGKSLQELSLEITVERGRNKLGTLEFAIPVAAATNHTSAENPSGENDNGVNSVATYTLSFWLMGKDGKVLTQKECAFTAFPPIAPADRLVAALSGGETGKNRRPARVTVTRTLEEARAAAVQGTPALLFLTEAPGAHTVGGAYCTDFWCYPMFRSISESMGRAVPVGTLGLLIQKEHPALAGFPCETYTTPEWFCIAERSTPRILDGTDITPIVQVIDNFERNHKLGLIYEILPDAAGCDTSGTGTANGDAPVAPAAGRSPAPILVCACDLPTLIAAGRPEAKALMDSLVKYLTDFLRTDC